MSEQVSFALIGAAGYVAPRHLRAIKENDSMLRAALDPSDSVGIIDGYFPDAHFFTEFERFDRFVDLCRRAGESIDYIAICSPNYLHDAHVRFALRSGASAICEKPLVLNPWNLDGLAAIESDAPGKINTILQLRLHPAIITLRDRIRADKSEHIYDVDLTYITSRGRWYHTSWKGDDAKAGGIATNIGVHFFDMLSFVFGGLKRNVVHHREIDCAAGYLEYDRARVRWFLSINARDLPDKVRGEQPTYRSITVEGEELEFSGGFTDLHTLSYAAILQGNGFTIDDVRPSIETVAQIRTADLEPDEGERHPSLDRISKDGDRYRNGLPI